MKALHLFIFLPLFLISCNGQKNTDTQHIKKNIPIKAAVKTETPIRTSNLPAYLMIQSQANAYANFDFDSRVRSIFEDSKGNFWYGTDKHGVYRFDGKSLQQFTIEDDLTDNQVRTIQEDKEGNIWFNTGNGICRYDGKSITIMAEKWVRKPDNRSGKNQDWKKTAGDLWFDGGFNNGTYRYDGKELTYLAFPIPMSDSLYNHLNSDYAIYSIHEDDDNNIWFGTQNKGVLRYDGKSFEYINEQNLHAPVRSLFQTSDKNMWFGNNGGGLFQYDGKNLNNLTEEKGLTNHNFLKGHFSDEPGTLARIWSMEQDNDGNLWIGTIDAGVWKYDGKTLTNYTKKDGLGSNAIEAIYKDKKGKLWFGSKGGVFTFNGKSFDKFIPKGNC